MASDDLAEQIAREKAELAAAPRVPIARFQPSPGAAGEHGRCSLCGAYRTDLRLFDVFHGITRMRGGCCDPTP